VVPVVGIEVIEDGCEVRDVVGEVLDVIGEVTGVVGLGMHLVVGIRPHA